MKYEGRGYDLISVIANKIGVFKKNPQTWIFDSELLKHPLQLRLTLDGYMTEWVGRYIFSICFVMTAYILKVSS